MVKRLFRYGVGFLLLLPLVLSFSSDFGCLHNGRGTIEFGCNNP